VSYSGQASCLRSGGPSFPFHSRNGLACGTVNLGFLRQCGPTRPVPDTFSWVYMNPSTAPSTPHFHPSTHNNTTTFLSFLISFQHFLCQASNRIDFFPVKHLPTNFHTLSAKFPTVKQTINLPQPAPFFPFATSSPTFPTHLQWDAVDTMAQQAQALSSTPAAVATTRSQQQWVAADTTNKSSTWAEEATTDKPQQPWAEEDTTEQASLPHHATPSFLMRLLTNILCARRSQTSISHRKALFARSTATNTTSSLSHSLQASDAFDKQCWDDINYALDAHGFFN
jgi:hypothetical protein